MAQTGSVCILKTTRHIPLRAREYHARHASEQTMCLSYFLELAIIYLRILYTTVKSALR
jgi:hypothetical protein